MVALFKLCTPDGYTLNLELYTGVGVATPPLSSTESLVVRLLANHMDMGVTLFADNYYTSSFLGEYLQRKTYLCGTVSQQKKSSKVSYKCKTKKR